MAVPMTLPAIAESGRAASRHPSPSHKPHKRAVRFPKHGRHQQVVYPDIFAEHWLVESPRKIQYEKTTLGAYSQMGAVLEDFYADVANIPEKYITRAKSRTKTLMEYLMPRVTKIANQTGMKIRGWKYGGSTHDDTQVILPKEIDLLVLFEKFKFKAGSLEPGYSMVPLKKFRHKEGEKPDPYRFGRLEGTTYLSSILIARNMYEFVERALRNNPQVQLQPFNETEDAPQIVITFKTKHRFNIIPGVYLENDETYLVTRPYSYDRDPTSLRAWRINFIDKERKLMALLDKADRGVRRKAFKILKALVKVEHTLEGLTSYHVKTVLLHVFDQAVDHSPRWQKDSLEEAFMSLLRELLYVIRKRHLPHFFVRDYNLFENMEPRNLRAVQGRIAYLVDNPNELMRILKKRTKNK